MCSNSHTHANLQDEGNGTILNRCLSSLLVIFKLLICTLFIYSKLIDEGWTSKIWNKVINKIVPYQSTYVDRIKQAEFDWKGGYENKELEGHILIQTNFTILFMFVAVEKTNHLSSSCIHKYETNICFDSTIYPVFC